MKTYDLTRAQLVIGTVPISTVATEGISFESPGQDWTEIVDVSGEVTRSRTVQGTLVATLTVTQGSQAATELARLREIDNRTGRGTFMFYFRDWSSGTEISSESAYVRALPTLGYAQEVASQAWVVVLPSPSVKVGSIPSA